MTLVTVHHPVCKSWWDSGFDALAGTADRHTGGMLTILRTSEYTSIVIEVGCGHSDCHY